MGDRVTSQFFYTSANPILARHTRKGPRSDRCEVYKYTSASYGNPGLVQPLTQPLTRSRAYSLPIAGPVYHYLYIVMHPTLFIHSHETGIWNDRVMI